VEIGELSIQQLSLITQGVATMFWLVLFMTILYVGVNLLINPPETWVDWIAKSTSKNEDTEKRGDIGDRK
jgi:hypothetical protein